MSTDGAMTGKRAAWAAVMFGLFFVAVFFRPVRFLFPLLVVVFGGLCLWEMAGLVREKSLRLNFGLSVFFALLLVADGEFAGLRHAGHILALFVVAILAVRVLRSDYDNIAAEAGAALLLTAYIGLPMGMAAAMMHMTDGAGGPMGPSHLAFQVLVVFGGDTAAYFVGRRFGRMPFFRRISPKKTAEGAWASVIVSIAIAFVLAVLVGSIRRYYGLGHALLLGALLGVASPLGDLAESCFKRDAGRKDSGWDFTGHGGFLDIFDALLFGLPIQFCYIQLVLATQ